MTISLNEYKKNHLTKEEKENLYLDDKAFAGYMEENKENPKVKELIVSYKKLEEELKTDTYRDSLLARNDAIGYEDFKNRCKNKMGLYKELGRIRAGIIEA